jgi:GNAT superfamily N-acetyltransferase
MVDFATSASSWAGIGFRSYAPRDRNVVFGLLPAVGDLYPDGFAWLSRRLDDVEDGRARCTFLTIGKLPAGLAIETPKGHRCVKLSTFVVRPDCRGKGVGTLLLRWLKAQWLAADLGNAYVTMPLESVPTVRPLFTANNFVDTAVCIERYGPSRDELVMSWFSG